MPARYFGPVLLLLAVLGGCGSSDADQADTTVTDALGRTVRVERPVNRVISLAPNLTEVVYAAGAGSALVAVTSSADYPPPVDTLDRVSALPVDFEAVAAKQPDLVVATDQINPPGDTETFAALEVPVYFFSFSSLEDVFDAIRRMGTLLGTERTARDTARALQRDVDALRSRAESIPAAARPRVLVLIGDETLYSFGKGSYVHDLVELAGGRSITDSIDTDAPTLSEEYVLKEKPDVIVGAWGTNYDSDRLRALHPTWDVVPALRHDRVYSLPPALLLRPGPRLVDGARQLAARLHPDRLDPRTDASPPRPSTTSPVSAGSPQGTPES